MLRRFFAFLSRGRELAHTLPPRLSTALNAPRDSGLIEPLCDEVTEYLREVARYSRWFGVIVFAPLFVAVALAMNGVEGSRQILNGQVCWMLIVSGFSLFPFWPLVVIIPAIKKISSEKKYFDLLRILWLNADLLVVAVNATLLCYVIFSWGFGVAAPAILIFSVVWLCGPWVAYLLKLDLAYAWIRTGQTVLLGGAVAIVVASPVPLRHYQSWAQRATAEKLRPEEQKEITAQWESLQWFSKEGAPLVWYSETPDGYRLFAAPGFDSQTGMPLKPASDSAIRAQIGAAFRRAAAAAEVERAETKARVDKEAHERAEREELARSEAQRSAFVAARDALRALYISAGVTATASKPTVAFIVIRNGAEDIALTNRFSDILTSAGVEHRTGTFTSDFISSAIFSDLRNGRFHDRQDFRVADFASAFLLVELSEQSAPSEPAKGVSMARCDTTCRLRLTSASTFREEFGVMFSSKGTAFDEATARSISLNRLADELATHTTALAGKIQEIK